MVAVGDHTLKVYTEGPNPPPKELASLEIQVSHSILCVFLTDISSATP